jgi:thioredoxin reductase
MFDVIVIGGGPAGLSAALMLGRCRRRVLVCDDRQPRNRHSRALHGYLTRDGIDPSQLTALGRAELVTYGVELREVTASAVTRFETGFAVSFESGGEERSAFLLIATGVVDELPEIPGLRECYGRSVFHCPYCDGWERRDRRLAALGRGKSGTQLALSLKTWSASVALMTDGARLHTVERAHLARRGIDLVTDPVARFEHDSGQLTAIACMSGKTLPMDAVFFTTGQHSHSRLARDLGCSFNRRGTVDTGNQCETNIPGLFVAGDASRDAQFVVVAAAEGVKAALAINRTLQEAEDRR